MKIQTNPTKEKQSVDDKNWETLFNMQFDNLQGKISRYWIEGFSRLGLDNSRVPSIEEINKVAKKYTGWEFVQDGGDYFDPLDWHKMTIEKKMPVSDFVRTPEELYYCSQPDMWHDIFGHICLLMTEEYAEMYRDISKLYLEAADKGGKKMQYEVGTMNWFITEVALVKEKAKLRAFGATLYSSSGELEQAFSKDPKPATLEAILALAPYDRSKIQDTYFVFESLEQIKGFITEYREEFLSSE